VALAYATRFGYVSPQAESAYQRAHELADQRTGPDIFPAVVGLWAYYQVRSDPERRRALGIRSYELSLGSANPAVRLEGLSALSTTLAFQGDFEESLKLIDQGLALSDECEGRDMTFFMPQHPVAGFCAISGPLLWSSGRFVEASRRYEHCRAFAESPRGVVGPFTSGYAHTFCAWMCELQGDYDAASDHAKAAMAMGEEHGFLVWIGAGYIHLGIATAMLGNPTIGANMITEGIEAWRSAGSGLFVSYFRHGLGLAWEAAGDRKAALSAVDDGIAHTRDHAERFALAELHRLRARLLAAEARGRDAAAERREAARVANRQGARMLELLALADLCQADQHQPPEARRLAELVDQLSGDAAQFPALTPVMAGVHAIAEGTR
jgi:tetratricopeptide (TPR) repeat protein